MSLPPSELFMVVSRRALYLGALAEIVKTEWSSHLQIALASYSVCARMCASPVSVLRWKEGRSRCVSS